MLAASQQWTLLQNNLPDEKTTVAANTADYKLATKTVVVVISAWYDISHMASRVQPLTDVIGKIPLKPNNQWQWRTLQKNNSDHVLLITVVEIPCIPAVIQRYHVASSLAPEIQQKSHT